MEERVSHYYRQLLNTYLKILGGIIVFSVLVSFLVWQYINQAHHTIITGFHIVLTLYVIANYILTQVSFKGRLNDLSKVRDLSIRMEEYREASGIRWMLWLVVAFLAWVSMLISGDFSFLIYVALSIFLFLVWCPTKERARRHIGIRQF
jgi:hypothetical protein